MISFAKPEPAPEPLSGISRRRFIFTTSAVTGAVLVLPSALGATKPKIKSANDKISVGIIGAGGKGESDLANVAAAGGEIAALCDVDSNTITARSKTYPKAQTFKDFRVMLEKMKEIDAVTVSIPDHCHAVAAMMAMKMGKHVYCQKPLAHSVYECRMMRAAAKKYGVATQMGNQGSAGEGLRRAVEVVQANVIGTPRELHVWCNRPIWPQGLPRPTRVDPVPPNLDWDLWLGPAPFRPFSLGDNGPERNGRGAYHTFNWRGWRDFGTGALGDMACHTVNMPFRALKLGYPNVVECEETSQLFPDSYPKASRIRFEFPAREGLPPLKFWWYDGNPSDKVVKPYRPHPDLTKEIAEFRGGDVPSSGALIIGDKGKVFSDDDYGSRFFLLLNGEPKYTNGATHEACKNVPITIPRNEGPNPRTSTDERQKLEWFRAIRGGIPAYSNFDIAAYLTEIILLGCVAMNVGPGKRLDWDGPGMRAKNNKEAAKFVKFPFRKGYKL